MVSLLLGSATEDLRRVLSCPWVAPCAALCGGSELLGVEAGDVGLCHDGAAGVSNERAGWQMRQLRSWTCATHYEGLIVWVCQDAAWICRRSSPSCLTSRLLELHILASSDRSPLPRSPTYTPHCITPHALPDSALMNEQVKVTIIVETRN
jgi:hypothetical protein